MWNILAEAPCLSIALGMLMFNSAFNLWWKCGWNLRSLMYRLNVIGMILICFGIYELNMKEWEKTVRNPIRVDLVFIMPFVAHQVKVGNSLMVFGEVLSWFISCSCMRSVADTARK